MQEGSIEIRGSGCVGTNDGQHHFEKRSDKYWCRQCGDTENGCIIINTGVPHGFAVGDTVDFSTHNDGAFVIVSVNEDSFEMRRLKWYEVWSNKIKRVWLRIRCFFS